MACVLCGGPDHPAMPNRHPILNCAQFAKATQPLKDMIRELWSRDPQAVKPGTELSVWIYEHLYAAGATADPRWTHVHSSAIPDPRGNVDERVYLAVRGARLTAVWAVLDPYFRAQPYDVIQAKHCVPGLADSRPDAIVIYMRNKAAVWRFCDALRDFRKRGLIADQDFNRFTPPGTGRIPDLPGVATARQPDGSDLSYGMQLCDLIGEAFDRRNRPVRVPTWLDFAAACLAHLKQSGVDIARPWNRQRQGT